jgi:hypothetical protein
LHTITLHYPYISPFLLLQRFTFSALHTGEWYRVFLDSTNCYCCCCCCCPLSLLYSSLDGSHKSTGLTNQALPIHSSAKTLMTTRLLLSITAFCIRIYKAERRLCSFKLSCNSFGVIPVMDSTSGIMSRPFQLPYSL